MAYVTEALGTKKYNKTLKAKLQESIAKASADDKKVMEESLDTLGLKLNETFKDPLRNIIYEIAEYFKESEYPINSDNWFGFDNWDDVLMEINMNPGQAYEMAEGFRDELQANIRANDKLEKVAKRKGDDFVADDDPDYGIFKDMLKRLQQAMSKYESLEEALTHKDMADKKVTFVVNNALSREIDRTFGDRIIDRDVLEKNKIKYTIPYDNDLEQLARRIKHIAKQIYTEDLKEDSEDLERMELNHKLYRDDTDQFMNKNESLNEATFGFYHYKYSVYVIASDGRNILLGGSKTLEGAEEVGINKAKQIFENPWMTNDEKFRYLENMYIADDDEEHEVPTREFDDYVDGLMSELDSHKDESLEEAIVPDSVKILDSGYCNKDE